MPGEDEPLHAFITAANADCVKKAVEKINEVIKQGIEVPEGHNDLRRMQLRELAQLNGTLRETEGPRCTNCGSNEHKSWLCPDKPNVTNNIMCSSCGAAGHIAKVRAFVQISFLLLIDIYRAIQLLAGLQGKTTWSGWSTRCLDQFTGQNR